MKTITTAVTRTKIAVAVLLLLIAGSAAFVTAGVGEFYGKSGTSLVGVNNCVEIQNGVQVKEIVKKQAITKEYANGCQDIGYGQKDYVFKCVQEKRKGGVYYYKKLIWEPCLQKGQYDQLTQDLLSAGEDYSKAKKDQENTVLDKLRVIAHDRKNLLASLIKSNPSVAANLLLTSKELKKLPVKMLPDIEHEVTVAGEFVRLHIDDFGFDNSEFFSSQEKYFIKTPKGESIPTYFEVDPLNNSSGDKIEVKGFEVGNDLFVPNLMEYSGELSNGKSIVNKLKLAMSTITDTEAVLASGPQVKKVAIILFNLQNSSDVVPYTPDEATAAVFTDTDSVNAYFHETSFGQISLEGLIDPRNGDVFGWYTLSQDQLSCDDNLVSWANEAQLLAAGDGFDESNYDYVVFGVNTAVECGSAGVSGGAGEKRVYNLSHNFLKGTVAHEIGHSMGLGHAQSYSCEDANGARVILSNLCSAGEYGDMFSIMGWSSGRKHFNNAQKNFLGWFKNDNVREVDSSGIYTIAPIEFESENVQLLRIPYERDNNGNVVSYYDLEYRQPFGFDNFLPADPAVSGVLIRISRLEGGSYQTYLLDATPRTHDFSDASFQIGSSFRHPQGDFQINILNIAPDFVEVEVRILQVDPTLTVTKNSSFHGDGLEDVAVISEPAGINCGRICSSTFSQGTAVTLRAVPNDYAQLGAWQGTACGIIWNPECRFSMNSDKTAVISFSRSYQRNRDEFLNINASVSNEDILGTQQTGVINMDPPDEGVPIFAYGTSRYDSFIHKIGSIVNLRHIQGRYNFVFDRWSRADCLDSDFCQIPIINGNNNITAIYEKQSSLTIYKRGRGTGHIVSSPSGIDCGSDCFELFGEGTPVTITAIPGDGSVFEGWSDPRCGGSQTCTITIGLDSPQRITADFSIEPLYTTLTVRKNGSGHGSIISSPPGIDCGFDCGSHFFNFIHGTHVLLTAIPDSESIFLGWTESALHECILNNECAIDINTVINAEANFGQRFFCTDSDDGDNLTIRGTVTTEDRLTGEIVETLDECHGNYIWEYRCTEDKHLYMDASETCPESFECREGACHPSNLRIAVSSNNSGLSWNGSPQNSIRAGSNVLLASFNITNTNEEEIVVNELVVSGTGSAISHSDISSWRLGIGNISYQGNISEDGSIKSFGVPPGVVIEPNSTKTVFVYANVLDSLVGEQIGVQLVNINSSAHVVAGIPLSSNQLQILNTNTAGFADPSFFAQANNIGVEIENNGHLRVIVINSGELRYLARVYYKVEWLNGVGEVLEEEEIRGDRISSTGDFESVYFHILPNEEIVKARITLDSRNLLEESIPGEANNIRIIEI